MSEQGYGGFWIRFLALLVDSVIITTALVAIAFLAFTFMGAMAIPVIMIAYTVGPFLYWIIMHASARQATYGKALLGMVVTTAEGDRLSLLRSIARELGKILSSLPLMLGYVAAGLTKQKQALHDVVASTTVIRHDSGRVALALLVGVLGWVAPVALVFVMGAGTFTSRLKDMSPGVLQSALGGATADSTAPADSTVVQAGTAPAARDTSRPNAAPTPAPETKAPAPVRTTPQPQPSAPVRTTPQPQSPVVLAAAPTAASTEAPQRPRPRPEPAVEAPDPALVAALDQLSPRFSTEVALMPAQFRDRTVQLYDFGAVPRGAGVERVFWPIHGFDARGNPVAIRGQRPIFTTIPRLGAYSGVWQLVYVVTADMAQPNALRDAAAIDAAVRARRATLRDANVVLNLPIVPRGTTLAGDTTRASLGWYRGNEVQFFDFGAEAIASASASALGFAAARDSAGRAIVVAGDSATEVRNLQFAAGDGLPASRVPSPLRAFSDMRAPSPPRPTRSP